MHTALPSTKLPALFTVMTVLALAAVAVPASAQKVVPGLWETSMTMKMQGGQAEAAVAKMQQELAKMPPEQRKMVEDMMAKQGLGAGSKPNSVRSCITAEQAARQDLPQDEARCKREMLERSGNKMRFKLVCEGPPPSTGEGEFTFISDKAYDGRVLVDSLVKGQPQRMEMQISGHWVGADCGSVKPRKAP